MPVILPYCYLLGHGPALPQTPICVRQLRTPVYTTVQSYAQGGDRWRFGDGAKEGHCSLAERWVWVWRGGAANCPSSSGCGRPRSSWWLGDNKIWVQSQLWPLRHGSKPPQAWVPDQGTCPHKGPGGKLSSGLGWLPHLCPWRIIVITPLPWGQRSGPRQLPPRLGHRLRRQSNVGFWGEPVQAYNISARNLSPEGEGEIVT